MFLNLIFQFFLSVGNDFNEIDYPGIINKNEKLEIDCMIYQVVFRFLACVIFITMPITVAGAEFSKVKLIKNYLRNSCGKESLSSIDILSIEKERTKTLNIEKIIDNFDNAKSRKFFF